MYNVAFDLRAEKEFLKLPKESQTLVTAKIVDLQNGNFATDKALKGKHSGKFRKRAGNYRIIYLREDQFILITVIRIAHRKEVY